MGRKILFLVTFVASLCAVASPARAGGCGHRLGIAAGLVYLEQPSGTHFAVGAEYECRMDPLFGLGGFANYIFAEPAVTFVGLPELFVHPLAGDFYVAASPLLETGSEVGTHLGVRFSTRLPIPIGIAILVPSFALDFINGGRNYWFGLGIAI